VPDGSGGSGGGNTCNGVSCPAIACVNGYHYETAPDQCCGVCVPDGDACSKGQAAYHDLREKLLADLSATACTTNNDCTLLGNNSQCGDQCAADAVNVLAASSVNAELSQFAAANCSTCKTIAPPCAAPPPPLSVAGRCSIYYLD